MAKPGPATEHVVDPPHAGVRIDIALADLIPGLSRRQAARAIDAGWVLVDERRVSKSRRLQAGERVRLTRSPLVDLHGTSSEGELPPLSDRALALVHRDLLVVDKPAGLPCQPLRPDETRTLVHWVVARFPEVASAGPDPREGGLLHRIDVDTSGVVALARNRRAFDLLRPEFAAGGVAKRYQAIAIDDVSWQPPPGRGDRRVTAVRPLDAGGVIDFALGRATGEPGTMIALVRGDERIRGAALAATTSYRVLARGDRCALLAIEIAGGRMHQIRAHLAAIGHPLVGDVRYGGADPALARQALHASELRLEIDGSGLIARAPLPDDLLALCRERAIDLAAVDA